MGILSATVTGRIPVQSEGGETTYSLVALEEGTDYKLDRTYGAIERIKGGALPPKAELRATYEYGDPSLVTAKEIIGAVDAAGLRTGIQAFVDAPTKFGYKPRILIAPGYAIGTSVGTALQSMAEKIYAHAYLDVPVAATVVQCIEGRGPDGAINLGTSSDRAVILYPRPEVVDRLTDKNVFEPYCQNLAGLACNVDATENFWASPSNHELRRVVGMETPIQWDIQDPNCEANLLNEVGIVTMVRPFGKGYTVWGNHSAAWPSETHPINFISVRVVGDYLREVVERALLPFMDRPMTKPVLASIREKVLAVTDGLVRKGALYGASFRWPEEDNPVAELAAGKVYYELSFMPPVPLQTITVRASIDTGWLKTLYGAA
jgi:phage tail sheath protein FI